MFKKNYIWILISLVLITLLGLITIQSFWIKSAIDVKETQFNHQVNSALSAIVKSLQEEEMVVHLNNEIYKLQNDSTPETSTYDTLKSRDHSSKKDLNKPLNFSKEIYSFRKTEREKIKANISVMPATDSGTKLESTAWSNRLFQRKKNDRNNKFKSIYEKSVREKELLVENIVNRLIKTPLRIEEKLNNKLLNRVIQAELKLNGITTPYQYAIKDESGNTIFKSDSFDNNASSTSYLTRLYPDDIFDQPYFLSIYFPEIRQYIFRSVGFIIISSVVLTLILVVIIGSAIYIIFRQKRLSLVKTDFINNMTHELKTPISTISLASQLLGDPNVPNENKNIEYLSKLILDESKRLGLQVEKVLQMAVFDRTQIKLRIKRININDLIDNVLNNFNIQVKSRNGHVIKELNASDPFINVDEVHITNVIYNLLDNAVKYCVEEPIINISTRNNNDGVIVDIKDNGIGISKENLQKIFDQFYRVPTGNIHNVKGFGMGLNYVRKIVLEHKGNVTVESKPGQGSTFSVHLPFKSELIIS
jgi:two-component system, OmpR family, phosphate regulon sensor histidine kinase PhoR